MKSRILARFLLLISAPSIAVILFLKKFDNYVAPMEMGLAAACALLLAGAAVSLLAKKVPFAFRPGAAGIFFILCAAFRISSIAWSPEKAYSLYECANIMIYLAVFLLLSAAPATPKDRDRIGSAIAAFAFLFSAHGIMQYAGRDVLPDISRYQDAAARYLHVYSIFGNSNLLAGFLAVALAPAAALLSRVKSARSKIVFFVAFSAIIATIILSNSRIAAVTAIASIILVITSTLFKSRSAMFQITVFLAIISVFAALSLSLWSGNKEKTRSATLRTMYISSCWSMFKDRPMGSGPGTFKVRYLDYQRKYVMENNNPSVAAAVELEKPGHPHNELVYLLAESGPATALCFALSLLIPFAGVFTAGADSSRAMWGAAAFSFLLISMTGFPLLVPLSGMLWPVCVAMSDTRPVAPKDASAGAKGASRLTSALIIVLFAALVFSLSYDRTASARNLSAAKISLKVGDDQRARERVSASLEALPYNGEALFTAGALQMRAGSYGAAIDLFDDALRFSSDKNLEINRAAAQIAVGRIEEAEKRLIAMNETYPANRQFKLLLIDAQLRSQHFTDAVKTAKKALEAYPDDEYLKTVYRSAKNIAKSAENAE